MIRITLPHFAGLILSFIGCVVMLGWFTYLPSYIHLFPANHIMGFNVALCFFLAGIGLLIPFWYPSTEKILHLFSGSLILIISGLILSEHLFNYPLGINSLFVGEWASNTIAFPGRMTFYSDISFIFCGFVFILLPFTQHRVISLFIRTALSIVFFVSSIALLGYLFKFQLLYARFENANMALVTSISFLILGSGLWSTCLTNSVSLLKEEQEDKKILLLSTVILLSVAIIAGLAGFTTSIQRNEIIIQQLLKKTQQGKIDIIEKSLQRPLAEIKTIEENPLEFQEFLLSKKYTNLIGPLLLTTSFNKIYIENMKGQLIYSSSPISKKPNFIIPLNLPYQAKLIWKNGYALQLSVGVFKDKQQTGVITAEWPLPLITGLFSSDESFICGLTTKEKLDCFIRNATVPNSSIFPKTQSQSSLLKAALNNKEMIITDVDYQDNLAMTIYTPVHSLGIGFIVKNNVSEIYLPLREQLQVVIPILLFTIITGILLLYWRVLPLIRQVILSKNQAMESEARFRSSFDSAATGMALLSLKGQWLRVNPALCELLGYKEDELLSTSFKQIIYPEDLPALIKQINALVSGDIENFQLESRYHHKLNRLIWGMIHVSLIRNREKVPLHLIIQIQDITEKKKVESELSYHAYYDTLTGLANRNQLERNINKAISPGSRASSFAVFFIDLDNFKQINDSLGHDAGDELLRVIANRLKHGIQKNDFAARLGGDEFILVLYNVSTPENAAVFAENILASIAMPITIHHHDLFITASIGISFYPTDGTNHTTLIKNADLALYQTKTIGGNNYQFRTPQMNAEVAAKVNFKIALQKALENREFRLHYQPRFGINTHTIVGVEALLRWKTPQYGLVPAPKIISFAEDMGLITPLSEWILKTACIHLKEWQQQGFPALKMSVNVAARHFKQSNFSYTIFQTLNNINVDPSHLELEINENLIMQDPEYSLKVLYALKDLGIHITIDNFGTGYSSLNYLNQFKVDRIKIDTSLIQKTTQSSENQALVSSIIQLAKNLEIKVIAEGIETKEQYDLLIRLGCDEIQGYYFCHPLSGTKMNEFLQSFSAQTLAGMRTD